MDSKKVTSHSIWKQTDWSDSSMSELKENTKTICTLLIINATSRWLLHFFIDVNLLFLKQSLQTHFVRSCRDTYVFFAMYCWLYGDIIFFLFLLFLWLKMANYAKKLKTSFWQNERWQKHKSTWFDFVYPFAFKNRYWFKTFFSQNRHNFWTLWHLKWGLPYNYRCSSPTISHSGLILVLYAKQITVLRDFIIAGWIFWWKRQNYHFRKSCVSFAFKYI